MPKRSSKPAKRTVQLIARIEVSYHEYDSAKKNAKAVKQIVRSLKQRLSSRLILYVEKDRSSCVEDETHKVRAKIAVTGERS